MIRLTKLFDLLGLETQVTIIETDIFGNNETFSGTCGDCPKEIWCCAYAESLKYDVESARYIIIVKYM